MTKEELYEMLREHLKVIVKIELDTGKYGEDKIETKVKVTLEFDDCYVSEHSSSDFIWLPE
jgi:hypothetical protein